MLEALTLPFAQGAVRTRYSRSICAPVNGRGDAWGNAPPRVWKLLDRSALVDDASLQVPRVAGPLNDLLLHDREVITRRGGHRDTRQKERIGLVQLAGGDLHHIGTRKVGAGLRQNVDHGVCDRDAVDVEAVVGVTRRAVCYDLPV